MVFVKGDPEVKEFGRKGGKTGRKFLETISKDELRKLTSKAGKASARKRKAKKAKLTAKEEALRIAYDAEKAEKRMMHDYLR